MFELRELIRKGKLPPGLKDEEVLALRREFGLAADDRYGSVTAELPFDQPELRQKAVQAVLDLILKPQEGLTREQAIDRACWMFIVKPDTPTILILFARQ